MTKEFIVDEQMRLDKFLTIKLKQTRNQVEQLIKKNYVQIPNKKNVKTGLKLQLDQKIILTLPKVQKKEHLEVNFDVEILYEDESILVINKPSGLIVHDAPSVSEATLVDWLKKYGISLSTISGEQRHGIVHRLDKGTSGTLVIAKTNEAHVKLSKQLEDKTMGRYYLAVVDIPLKDDIVVQTQISRNPNNRLKMANLQYGKMAKTSFKKLIQNKHTQDNGKKYELITAKLFTGRTHQIRVHLESLNRHILGDSLYGFNGNDNDIKRVYLHAYRLYLVHPITNENLSFVANIPLDMKDLIDKNFDDTLIKQRVDKEFITQFFD
jgi:23S rRNA pseudouridine1911/1915/1917 synthase